MKSRKMNPEWEARRKRFEKESAERYEYFRKLVDERLAEYYEKKRRAAEGGAT